MEKAQLSLRDVEPQPRTGDAAWQPDPAQLAFLDRASCIFFDPGDYAATVAALGELLVPALADWCAIDLVCEDGSLARVATHHRDAARLPLAAELRQLPPAVGPLDPERVTADGTAELALLPEADPEPEAAGEPRQGASILRRLGTSSVAVLPLAARGRRLGALTLARGDSGRLFSPSDLPFAGAVAGRCALALDNARVFREAEEGRRLAEASARAQEDAARFGEQLLGIVSHDLRTPLAAIQASTHAALRRAGGDEALERALRRAAGSAERMARMVEDLLDFTRARLGGGIPIARREADLGKIARYAVEEAQAALPEHPFEHRLHYEKGLYDPDRLSQLVQNLLNNAVEHGAPRAPVLVETRRDGDTLLLEVTSQGPVIPASQLEGLFEPFRRRASGATRNLGLGLFIVREIARAHGGSVAARSAAEGTTFTVRLPRHAHGG